MTELRNLNAPWEMKIENDGTENVAVIYDCFGKELVRTSEFWLSDDAEKESDLLSAIRIMAAAPKLLTALNAVHDADYLEGAFQPTVDLVEEAISEADPELHELLPIRYVSTFTEGSRKFIVLRQGKRVWEEPIAGWEQVIDLLNGVTAYNHPDGRVAI